MTSSSPPAKPPKKSPAEIEQELAAVRRRFTATLDEISVRTQPDELGKDVSAVAQSAADDMVATVKDWTGLGEDAAGPRPELLGALAGAGLAIVILLLRSRRASVTYEFTLPNDSARIDGIVVRARGRTVPSGIGGRAV